MDRARPPGRRLPAGNQGHFRSGARRPLRDAGLLVLLARREGLFRRRASRQQGVRSRAPRLFPSRRSITKTASSPSTNSASSRSRRSTCRTAARTFPPRCNFSRRWTRTRRRSASGRHARAVRRYERGAHRARRASEGTQAARDRPASRGARADRAHHRSRPGRSRPRGRSGQRQPVYLVAAVAKDARAKHRVAARLRAGSSALAAKASACPVQKEVGTSDHAPVFATFTK